MNSSDYDEGTPAALAALVTQADSDEITTPVKPSLSQRSTPERELLDAGGGDLKAQGPATPLAPPRGLCRCLLWRRAVAAEQPTRKLASIVPAPEEPAAEAGSLQAAAAANVLSTEEASTVDSESDRGVAVTFTQEAVAPSETAAQPEPIATPPDAALMPEASAASTLPAPAAADAAKDAAAAESQEHAASPEAVAKVVTAKPSKPQLGPQEGANIGRKTLVLDLDETLVHSSFRACTDAEIISSIELEGERHSVYVRKRPGVDEFLAECALHYEVVIYTASMAKYANPLLDLLDSNNVVAFRLFREACTRQPLGYVKDLSKLGRELSQVIIIDNSPICYALQPENAIPVRTWKDDKSDRELYELIPILQSLAGESVPSMPDVLGQAFHPGNSAQGEGEVTLTKRFCDRVCAPKTQGSA